MAPSPRFGHRNSVVFVLFISLLVSGCDSRQEADSPETPGILFVESARSPGDPGFDDTVAIDADWRISSAYMNIRSTILGTTADEFGFVGTRPEQVFIMLIERGDTDRIVTFLGGVNGEANLYFSDGGALLQLQNSKEVRTGTLELLDDATRYVEYMTLTDSIPLPTVGQIRVTFLTSTGLYTTGASFAEIEKKQHPLTAFLVKASKEVNYILEQIEGW